MKFFHFLGQKLTPLTSGYIALRIICGDDIFLGENLGSINRGFFNLVLSCTVTACAPAASHILAKKNKDDAAITNGTEVSGENILGNSIVAVVINNLTTGEMEICSGTLLKNNLVLTAAHCVDGGGNALDISIIFDRNITDSESSKETYRKVTHTAIPAWWNAPGHLLTDTGDVALLKFAGQVPANYTAITSLASGDDLKNNAQVIIAGYGVNQISKTPINVDIYPDLISSIQSGKVICQDPVRLINCSELKLEGAGVLRQAAASILNNHRSSSEIELQQITGNTCHGDSGGPAFILKNNKLYLLGVANRSSNNSVTDCSTTSIYANVNFFREWLNLAASKLKESTK